MPARRMYQGHALRPFPWADAGLLAAVLAVAILAAYALGDLRALSAGVQ